MVGKYSNKKRSVKELEDFINPDTGETIFSEVGTITSINTRDEDFVIINGEDFVIVEKEALKYLSTVLTPSEMGYVRLMSTMVGGEYNVLNGKDNTALTRVTLQAEIEVAKTTFINLMSKLHKEGVISYLETYIRRNKKVKFVVMSPTLARKSKRIRATTAKLFKDLRKGNV